MKASKRSHGGLLSLYSDRDTQGLTLHIILCFLDATYSWVHEFRVACFTSRWEMMNFCRTVTQQESGGPAGLQSGPKERERERREQLPCCYSSWKEAAVVGTPLLNLSWCYDTSAVKKFLINFCLRGADIRFYFFCTSNLSFLPQNLSELIPPHSAICM